MYNCKRPPLYTYATDIKGMAACHMDMVLAMSLACISTPICCPHPLHSILCIPCDRLCKLEFVWDLRTVRCEEG